MTLRELTINITDRPVNQCLPELLRALEKSNRTGESVSVEEKWVPFFKTGKELRERLNA